MIFLSTPSARRATDALPTLSTAWMISIHALREEGDSGSGSSAADSYNISIHALREEGDTINQLRQAFQIQFLSTPSARRATELTLPVAVDVEISIHALREEGD